MMTRRDLALACLAAACGGDAFALSDEQTVLGSAVFDWNSVPAKPTEAGSVRPFFKERTATLEQLEVHVTTLNPGKSPHPPHRHPNEEMIIVQQGTVEGLVNGEWKGVGPGSVIFFASNQLHGLRNAGNAPAIYHVINWKTSAKTSATPAETHSM